MRINVDNPASCGPWAGVLVIPVSLLEEVSYVTDYQLLVKNEEIIGLYPRVASPQPSPVSLLDTPPPSALLDTFCSNPALNQ